MSFETVIKKNPYVMIDVNIINDVRISWAAKGLLVCLLVDQPYVSDTIVELEPELVNELVATGYLNYKE